MEGAREKNNATKNESPEVITGPMGFEVTGEEKEFAISIADTVGGWLYDPIPIRKYGPGYDAFPHKASSAIEQWYNIWRTVSVSDILDPTQAELMRHEIERLEKEITEWFKSYQLEPLNPSLLTEEEIQGLNERIPEHSDYLNYYSDIGKERVKNALNDLKRIQGEEFEKLKKEMPKFNVVAARMNGLQKNKEAQKLGISVSDYEFMFEFEMDVRGYPDDKEAASLWYELVGRWTGRNFMDFMWHKYVEEVRGIQNNLGLSNKPTEIVEQLLRNKLKNARDLQALEKVKINAEKYKSLRIVIGESEISSLNNYAQELIISEKHPEYPK
ncbi:MAG: hypothetical protein HYT98_02510 [Candidatus Sungbacteria bacterium]|nr:hypothetical protein [Candidatus Sungbacteria bacterium]